MLVVVALVITGWLLPKVARWVVAILATIIAIILIMRADRVTRTILENGRNIRDLPLNSDRKPTRTERRTAALALRLAIQQTELRSLFPHTFACAERLVRR